MAELPEMGDVPIILIAGPDGPDARVGGPALIEWLDAPEDGEALARAVGRLVEGAFRPAVVTIDEDASRRSALVRRLTALGLACGEVNDIEAARRRLTGTMPDLVTFKIGTSSGSLRLLDMLCHSCAPSVPLLVYPDRYMTGEDDRALRLAVTRRLLTARHSEQNLPAALRELLEAIFARRTERRQPDRSVA
jgi:hypothetical protein